MVIYKTTNTINQKFYIGVTTFDLKKRRTEHLRKRFYSTSWFHRSINKYGIKAFTWEVIAVASSFEDLIELEKRYIAELKPEYNMSAGGEGSVGRMPWNKGKKFSQETRSKMSESAKGRLLSEETKNKMSKVRIGKVVSEDTKRKISQTRIMMFKKPLPSSMENSHSH